MSHKPPPLTVPHPDQIRAAIIARREELLALRRLLRIAQATERAREKERVRLSLDQAAPLKQGGH
jgi:hypothetical protein